MPVHTVGPAPADEVVASAIHQVCSALPSSEPYRVWRTHELRDPLDGRRHAVPLLVLTQNGLWVVSVDRHRGVLDGDDEVWKWRTSREEHTVEAPFHELDDLTRRLREALQRRGHKGVDVRSLVLLASEGVALEHPDRFHRRAEVTALPGLQVDGLQPIDKLLMAHPDTGRAVGSRSADAIAEALREAGLHEASHRQVVGGYRLGALLADHDIWQEHDAVRLDDESQRARVRSWVLPRVDDPDRRDALQRAAVREAEVLGHLGRHPNILGLIGTVQHEGLPRLVFEPFHDALRLHQFLRAHPDLTFEDRLDILQQIADALDHCHRNDVTHRNLSPDSVLVRFTDRVEVRLHRFEGAVARQAEATTLGTRHLSHFTERMDDLYRAPEVYRDPDAADAQSDLFSLGALAWYLFTGRHPGPTLPERAKQLRDDEGLHLWRVRDDLDDELDDAISAATRPNVSDREVAVRKWAASVLDTHREPTIRTWINGVLGLYRDLDDADARPVDPLSAAPGDPLGSGLVVESILGRGASARVLSVLADGQRRALKVPHDAGAARLLEAEAGVLRRIEHDGVVSLDDVVTLSGRPCLLMQHAGDETLADMVRKQGTLALDYVKRLGDELLEVLTHLHERGITHRDLKPSNLAFTVESNKPRRLLLFDFSLAAVPPGQIRAGTPGWRDPMLEERGEWDPAADLYACAAVLHYALTGERPAWKERERRVRVVESRFDPDLRGVLTGFFARAFAPDPAERFLDAADMRHAWNEVFARDVTTLPVDERHAAPEVDARLARARLDTPIGALGLSIRALNALERAGVAEVRDLIDLPRNRLSLVRGVGRETRTEIGHAVDVLRRRLGSRDDATVTPFLPDAGLLPLQLEEAGLGLPEEAVAALQDAMIRTIRDLADCGADRVRRVLAPHGVDLTALRVSLGAHAAPVEGVIGDWVTSLLRPNPPSRRTRWEERSAALFGLSPLPGGDPAPAGGRTNAQVAEALGITPMVLRSTFQNARTHWDRVPELRDRVVAALGDALDRVGPVAPIPEVAQALLQVHAPSLRDDPRAQVQAVALVRFGTEVGLPASPFTWRRLGPSAWLARTDAALDALQALATAADRLARSDHPTALDAALQVLLPAAAPPLDALEPDVLVQRAVAASQRAALSPRLEVYPRGLPAQRAVELAAAVLTPGLDAEGIQKRVATRYPEAEPLPGRPQLDALLERVGLRWSTDRSAYLRPGTVGSTLTFTEAWRTSAASLVGAGPREPGQIKAERFNVTLQRSLESGRFRVIQVSARAADAAATALRQTVPGLVVSSLDALLWEGLQARIAQAGADPDFVLTVDRAGPEGEHWPIFVDRFVKPVANEVIDRLLADRAKPRLLLHPGLLARYGLTEALDTLVRRAEAEEGQGIWLLLPSWDDGAKPLLRHPYGDVPVPIFKPAQRLRAPRGWISQQRGR